MAAAPPEYRAGAARTAHVVAVALEDRRGYRAVFAEADFPITRAVSDLAAVQLVKAYDLDRAAIAISGTGGATPDAGEIVSAAAQALGRLDAAAVSFSGAVSIATPGGACVATLYPVRLEGCRQGAPVRGPIRAAFRMLDVPHALATRDAAPRAYPVQAIALGKQAVILALGGSVEPGRYEAPGRIVVPFANDSAPMPRDARIEAAIGSVINRVR